jgi:hypothetical protein
MKQRIYQIHSELGLQCSGVKVASEFNEVLKNKSRLKKVKILIFGREVQQRPKHLTFQTKNSEIFKKSDAEIENFAKISQD